jgi:hypothetical protein
MSRSMKNSRLIRSRAALFIAFALTVSPNIPGAGLWPQAALPQQRAAPADGGWPRAYKLASGDGVVVYQPQIASWDDQKHMVAWSAISYQAQGATQPALGAVKIEADTDVAVNQRLVNFSSLRITEFNFPTLSRDQAQKLVSEFEKAMPAGDRVIALDRVLAGIDKSQIRPKAGDAQGIKADPPKIFHSTQPAVLMIFDGQPVWSPVKDVDLKYAVNTNWDLFEEPSSKTFYLRDDKSWLKATDLNGTWVPAGKLPDSFSKLPADDNWKDVRANLPGKQIAASAVPTVFESFEPAELILIKGDPKYVPVKGTSLLWVSNTESDLFRMGKDGLYYYLVAGRWFSAPNLGGPWTFATTSLPDDFKSIPVDHPRSRVLASVPGTDQAIEAVLLASIPQTARVNKKELKAPDVVYQGGAPEFKPIETTTLERAVNTDKEIIKIGDLYYMCFQGVWFMARSATGPWEVASSVPKEIYEIPASSPVYNVTYVKVEKDEPDWVTFAAFAGYTGMMIAWGCAVWGSGWYYPPYVWYGGAYPAYFWHPATYGGAAWYNPYTGVYGRGAAVYGPYGGAGGWAAYNPRTGTYARGGAVYGPYGSRGFAQAYNPYTGAYGATRQGSSIYGNWGSSYVQRGDDWAQTGHVTNYATGRTTAGARGSEGGAGVRTSGPAGSSSVARSGSGDIYAGHDGNVYRKQDGSWQKYSDGGWSQADKSQINTSRDLSGQTRQGVAPTQEGARAGLSTTDQLNRDWGARTEGAQRVRDNQNYQLGGGDRQSAGSYRGGGGGRFGGGRFGGGGFGGRRR